MKREQRNRKSGDNDFFGEKVQGLRVGSAVFEAADKYGSENRDTMLSSANAELSRINDIFTDTFGEDSVTKRMCCEKQRALRGKNHSLSVGYRTAVWYNEGETAAGYLETQKLKEQKVLYISITRHMF